MEIDVEKEELKRQHDIIVANGGVSNVQQAMSLMTNGELETQHNVHINKMRAHQYKEHVKLNDINRENIKILNRLVEISKGKCVKLN